MSLLHSPIVLNHFPLFDYTFHHIELCNSVSTDQSHTAKSAKAFLTVYTVPITTGFERSLQWSAIDRGLPGEVGMKQNVS